MLDLKRVIASAPKKKSPQTLRPLFTKWGEEIIQTDEVEMPHPRPQCARASYQTLNGWWDYRIIAADDAASEWRTAPIPVDFDGHIRVPFSPEAPLSGVNRQLQPNELLWYRRFFSLPPTGDGQGGQTASEEALAVEHAIAESEVVAVAAQAAAELGVSTLALAPELASTLALAPVAAESDAAIPAPAQAAAEIETVAVPTQEKHPEAQGKRLILHFEAVDYACACYLNGICVGTHIGGYLPFSFDITDTLADTLTRTPTDSIHELALCVYDPSDSGVQLRGKQKLARGGIWYTAQSGIWQSVWLETVPKSHIVSLALDAQADTGFLTLDVTVSSTDAERSDTTQVLIVRVLDGEEEVCRAQADLAAEEAAVETTTSKKLSCEPSESLHSPDAAKSRRQKTASHPYTHRITLALTEPKLWSPDNPHLYQLELRYGDDHVSSYCAFRSITMEEDAQGIKRLCINHRPYFLRGVLDQGYWPDGLLTAPSDAALVFDIQSMLGLGFNMLRKHIKVESERWYYHCDRLGMLVWQDMLNGGSPLSSWHTSYKPTFFRRSWGAFSDTTKAHYHSLSAENASFRSEWLESCAATVNHLKNHPSVITWVLFNEGWGQFEAARATELVRRLDPTRPIDAVSGWYDQACGDFLSVHNYFRPLEVYPDKAPHKRAFVISEFGGLSYHDTSHSSLETSYGYETFSDLASLGQAVHHTLAQADALEQQGLAGFVYTQLSDVEEETNGLLSYDRHINKLTSLTDIF